MWLVDNHRDSLFCFRIMAELQFPLPRPEVINLTRGRFVNCVAIVTGGASGIGRATAERLANDGASVAIFDINDRLGRTVADDLSARGLKVTAYDVDISKMDAVVAGVKQVVEKYGGINLLVNNAVNFLSAGT